MSLNCIFPCPNYWNAIMDLFFHGLMNEHKNPNIDMINFRNRERKKNLNACRHINIVVHSDIQTQLQLINFLLLACQSGFTVFINHRTDYDNLTFFVFRFSVSPFLPDHFSFLFFVSLLLSFRLLFFPWIQWIFE